MVLFSRLLAAWMVLVAFQALGQSPGKSVCEEIVDGGFENGHLNLNWQETTTGLAVINNDLLHARNGSWLAIFGGQLFEPLQQSLEQPVLIPPGRAELSYYLLIPESSTDELDHLTVLLDDVVLAEYAPADRPAYSQYVKVSHNLSDWTDGITHLLRFECSVTGTPVTTFYIDDVSMNLCPNPTPPDLFRFAIQWMGAGWTGDELISLLEAWSPSESF